MKVPLHTHDTVSRIVAAYQPEERGAPASPTIESTIHTLSPDRSHPIALEFSGTSQGRQISIRTTTPEHLASATAQLRACYPQALFQSIPTSTDPFRCDEHEYVSCRTLESGAASYLPLREWNPQIVARTATSDPILGILAALDTVPTPMRVVAQLTLVPAPDRWSQRDQRKAIQHALEPERNQAHLQATTQKGPSFALLFIGFLLLCLVLLRQQFQAILPAWVTQASQRLLTGHDPHLTLPQQIQLLGGLLFGWLLLIGIFIALYWIKRHLFTAPLYDMRQVERKTAQNAYRVRLRLFAISPDPCVRPRRYDLHRHAWSQAWDQLRTDLGSVWRRGRTTFHDHMSAPNASPIRLWRVIHATRAAIAVGGQRWWRSSRLMRAWRLHRGWRRRIQRTRTERQRWAHLRQDHLHQLTAAYRQYHLASGNYFRPRQLSPGYSRRLLAERVPGWRSWRHGWWQGVSHSPQFLTGSEIASLWHVPPSAMMPELALMDQQRMRTLLVPPSLAQAICSEQTIGISEHAGHRLSVGFPAECLHTHMLVVGKSGEGKSTSMEHLARVAMEQDDGLLVLDPHGDLVDHVLQLVPPKRADDVMIIDLADTEYSVGFNPLDVTMGRGRDKAISDLLKTLAHIWVGAWGPRMENAFEYALRTLYEANKYLVDQTIGGAQAQYTLLDVMQVLTSESFCHALLQHVTDPYILRWWNLYYDPLSMQMQRDRSDPVLSKVAKFESYIARRIVGQSTSTLHFADAIAKRKIMLFKLSKGLVGEDMARLLGATLLGLLHIALEEQGNVEQGDRRPLTIMVDEFQVLAGVDWGSIAELRKYGATFYLATQSLDYLRAGSSMEHTSVLSTVMSNVKQYMIFHVSARDAAILAPELGIKPEDLLNLDSYTCYIKVTYQARRQPTFSLHLDPPPRGDAQQAQTLIERSRRRYGVPAALIDAHLTTALITALGVQPVAEDTPPTSSASAKLSPPHSRRKSQEKRDRDRTFTDTRSTQHETPGSSPQHQTQTNETSSENHTIAMSWEETVGHLPNPSSKE